MRARATTIAVPLATATLALGTAAWATTGRLPLVAGDRVGALAVTAQAVGPLVANDHEGSAILSADALVPGATTTGEVTIRNAGDAAGVFTLAPAGATDTGAPPSGPLSQILDLSIEDVSGATPVTVFADKLAAMPKLTLGTFAAGAAHRYRFALTYPAGLGDAVDNAYQGTSASVGFDWDAVGLGDASSNHPTPPTTSGPGVVSPGSVGGSGSGVTGAGAGRTGTPATSAAAAAAIPATGSATGRFTVRVGRVKRRPVRRARLYAWVSTTTKARSRVTATVSWHGHRRMKLHATTVRTGPKRRTVRLRLPAAAVQGAQRKLTVRIAVTAKAGTRRATVRRTLRVRSR